MKKDCLEQKTFNLGQEIEAFISILHSFPNNVDDSKLSHPSK